MLAKKYCENIADGLATTSYQKQFVAFLHNATELFIKSAMLNNNDYRVMSKVKADASGNPAKAYYSSININAYFNNLIKTNPNALSSGYYSIEYNELIEKQKSIFEEYYKKSGADPKIIKDGLSVLKDLRNNETHFYINPKGFLSESTYIKLHNFMIDFYKLLKGSKLLPFFGTPDHEYSVTLDFDKTPLPDTFTYKQALLDSENAKIVADLLKTVEPFSDGLSAFEIADGMAVYLNRIDLYQHFDEKVAYIQMMLDYGVLSIHKEISKVETEDSIESYCEYSYVFQPGAFV